MSSFKLRAPVNPPISMQEMTTNPAKWATIDLTPGTGSWSITQQANGDMRADWTPGSANATLSRAGLGGIQTVVLVHPEPITAWNPLDNMLQIVMELRAEPTAVDVGYACGIVNSDTAPTEWAFRQCRSQSVNNIIGHDTSQILHAAVNGSGAYGFVEQVGARFCNVEKAGGNLFNADTSAPKTLVHPENRGASWGAFTGDVYFAIAFVGYANAGYVDVKRILNFNKAIADY